MPRQPSLFDAAGARSTLDRLLSESQLYRNSKDYHDLLDFIARMPHIAPFNAMLLQIQKPGLRFATSAKHWRDKFGRYPKEAARPLLIMVPFGPVGLVYDAMDTEGVPLPADAFMFTADGAITESDVRRIKGRLAANHMPWHGVDEGDRHAGRVRIVEQSTDPKQPHHYRININRNHSLAGQFTTLAHELGHIHLGHLGDDAKRKIKNRRRLPDEQREIEAESVAYLVCNRAGIQPRSEPYLSQFFASDQPMPDFDVYAVLIAVGQIESVLDLAPGIFRPTDRKLFSD